MRTKKLKGGRTIEEFMREQVEEEKQATHTLQEQVKANQPINLIKQMQVKGTQVGTYMSFDNLSINMDNHTNNK